MTSTLAPPEQRTITVPMKWQPATRAGRGERRVAGYASVFDSQSEDLGFRETIAPGAFRRALNRPGADHWLLWSHQQDAVLARSSAGTLTLSEDARGLRMEANLVNTTLGRDVHELVSTGHVRSMSFGFTVARDEWETRDGVDHRRVLEIGTLFEVSIVPEPAYAASSVEGRAATASSVERFLGVAPRIRDRSVYGADSKHSYFRDLALVEDAKTRSRDMERPNMGTPSLLSVGSVLESNMGGVKEAQARLNTIATRDLTSSGILGFASTDAPFAAALFETSARARAVIAAQFKQVPLERGGMLVTIPRITTGATTAIQATENSNVSETDPATGGATGAVKTIAGLVDVSQQLFDQTPGGVLDQAIAQELGEAIGTGMDVAVTTALLAAAGIVSVSYTDASPTPAENFGKVVDLRQQVHVASGEAPTVLILHPRRLSFLDETSTNPLQYRMIVVPSPSIPTNLGAGTNEDRALVAVADDVVLFSRPPELRIMVSPGSASLTVRIQVYQYFATVVRQPAGVGVLLGSGMIAPVL